MGTKKAQMMTLGAFLVFMFLSADVAYGLGGGGHHGDGRWDYPPPAAPAESYATPDGEQAPAPAGGSSSSGADFSFPIIEYGLIMVCANDVMEVPPIQQPISVPEPVAALLLVLGTLGLAGARRKFGL